MTRTTRSRWTWPAVLAACAGLVVGLAPPASAEETEDPPPGVTPGAGTVTATQEATGVALGTEPPAGAYATGELPPGYVVDTFEGLDVEGNPEQTDRCWGIRIGEEGEAFLRETWAEALAELEEYSDEDYLGRCAAEDTFDLVAYIHQAWRSVVRPPPPTPLRVAPGKAATGLLAYLEIGGDPAPTETLDNPIGPDVVITMTPRYVVRWGDGATTTTTSQGGPYPSGDVTHTYLDEGTVTITVEAYWTATWRAGGAGGELPELAEPTSAALDLPVEQYQAVID